MSELSSINPLHACYDAIVVGAGAAGLYTALCLPSHWSVALIAKDLPRRSASDWAQGGMAAVTAPDDSPDLHYQDTLRAGAGLCEPAAVRMLVEAGQASVQALLHLGVAFDRQNGETLALTLEAAHSRRRVLHAADTTGRAMVTTLLEQVLARPNIEVISEAFVLDVRQEDGRVRGLLLSRNGRIEQLGSATVILACGGGGQVFAHTTNPPLSTGDGVAIAWRTGATLRDLEFFQFHPTALLLPGAPRFLISEAVRGEGAHLVDQHGDRFALRYHPDGELAPRDVVSRAIYRHLLETGDPCVYLDLSPIPEERVRLRFPNILAFCRRYGLDPLQQPIPVAPAAHYWMGGVQTDLQGGTDINGLYAVGEAASTGVHGANRLASNSLLECIVFGQALARIPARTPPTATGGPALAPLPFPDLALERERQSLQQLLWQGAGICRTAAGMDQALQGLEAIETRFHHCRLTQALEQAIARGACGDTGQDQATLRSWGELRNLLTVSRLILQGALMREESRGGHYREDFPETDDVHWHCHTAVQGQSWQQQPLQSI